MEARVFVKQAYRIKSNSKTRLPGTASKESISNREQPLSSQRSYFKSDIDFATTVSGHWMPKEYSRGLQKREHRISIPFKLNQTQRSTSNLGFGGQLSNSCCKMQNSQTTKVTECHSNIQNLSQSSDFFVKRIDIESPVKIAKESQQ